MEDMNMRDNEIEEIENATEGEETSESSNSGAMLAGIVGGFLAYAIISGAKKLHKIVKEKCAAKVAVEIVENSVEETIADDDQVDVDTEDSEEN